MLSRHAVSIGIAGALLGLSSVAFAQTFSGSVNGEPQTWHVLSQGQQSTVSVSDDGSGVTMVVVQGHTQPSYTIKGTITINAAVKNGEVMGEPDVLYFPQTSMATVYTSVARQPGQFSLKVQNQTQSGAQVVGSYKGKLYRAPGIGQTPDMSDSIEVSVSFDLPAIKMKR